MRQLLYVSNTSRSFSADELNVILEQARANNASKNLTGMLLYMDGAFLQVLEGDNDAVGDIYKSICNDKRHWNTKILLDREAPRSFGEWSMGFERVPEKSQAFELDTNALNDKIDPGANLDLPMLLSTFYRINKG